ncbi:hypothetical protein L2D14_04575 [Thalassospiraceae bacterium LMO-JJ14]|nr:hypothetical protein L2D14_04575 [Thalassospiraceae bacterium LMO-JJ14]
MSKDSGPDGEAEQAGEDLQRLAREYADLWEQQIKAFTTDETLARTMAQTMELMNAGAANVAAMMQKAAQTPEAGTDDKGHDQGDGADGSGTTSAGASSGRAEPDVRELALRIAELEKRLARLEGLTEPAGKIATGKTAKS